jgi:hypothetical protein
MGFRGWQGAEAVAGSGGGGRERGGLGESEGERGRAGGGMRTKRGRIWDREQKERTEKGERRGGYFGGGGKVVSREGSSGGRMGVQGSEGGGDEKIRGRKAALSIL